MQRKTLIDEIMDKASRLERERYNAIENALLELVSEGSTIDHITINHIPGEQGLLVMDIVRLRGFEISLEFNDSYAVWVNHYVEGKRYDYK